MFSTHCSAATYCCYWPDGRKEAGLNLLSLHPYLGWQKFGFARCFDSLPLEACRERMRRKAAVETIERIGDQRSHVDFKRFCDIEVFFEISFDEICEEVGNLEILDFENSVKMIHSTINLHFKWR